MDEEQLGIVLMNPLSGKVLKTAIGELSRTTMIFWNASGNGTNEYGGYLYEELVWISLSLNFSVDMRPMRNSAFGRLVNGSWDGMFGLLQRKDIDLAVTAFGGILGSNIIDLAAYMRSEGNVMITQYPAHHSSIYGHIITFSPGVWSGLLLSMITCIIFMKLLGIFYRKCFLDHNQDSPSASSTTLSNISEYIFATLTNHGGYYRESSYRALGVIAATWCFATFVFVNVYCSCLTVYTSLIFQRPDINSLRELAENKNHQLMTVITSAPEVQFLNPQSTGLIKQVGDKLLRCPFDVCRTTNYDVAIQKVLDDKHFVTFVTGILAKMYMYKTFSNGTCRLTTAQYKTASVNYFMACTKNSPYSFPLFKASLRYHAFGLGEYWVNKYIPGAPQCQLKYNSWGECVKVVDLARLKLEQFYIAFAILFAGYVLALLQFLGERFIRY